MEKIVNSAKNDIHTTYEKILGIYRQRENIGQPLDLNFIVNMFDSRSDLAEEVRLQTSQVGMHNWLKEMSDNFINFTSWDSESESYRTDPLKIQSLQKFMHHLYWNEESNLLEYSTHSDDPMHLILAITEEELIADIDHNIGWDEKLDWEKEGNSSPTSVILRYLDRRKKYFFDFTEKALTSVRHDQISTKIAGFISKCLRRTFKEDGAVDESDVRRVIDYFFRSQVQQLENRTELESQLKEGIPARVEVLENEARDKYASISDLFEEEHRDMVASIEELQDEPIEFQEDKVEKASAWDHKLIMELSKKFNSISPEKIGEAYTKYTQVIRLLMVSAGLKEGKRLLDYLNGLNSTMGDRRVTDEQLTHNVELLKSEVISALSDFGEEDLDDDKILDQFGKFAGVLKRVTSLRRRGRLNEDVNYIERFITSNLLHEEALEILEDDSSFDSKRSLAERINWGFTDFDPVQNSILFRAKMGKRLHKDGVLSHSIRAGFVKDALDSGQIGGANYVANFENGRVWNFMGGGFGDSSDATITLLYPAQLFDFLAKYLQLEASGFDADERETRISNFPIPIWLAMGMAPRGSFEFDNLGSNMVDQTKVPTARKGLGVKLMATIGQEIKDVKLDDAQNMVNAFREGVKSYRFEN